MLSLTSSLVDPFLDDALLIPSVARVWGFADPFEDIQRDPSFRRLLRASSSIPDDTTAVARSGTTNKKKGSKESQDLSIVAGGQDWLQSYARAPLVDIIKRENEYLINVDIPGVRKEDVKVQLTENEQHQKLLTVSGERKDERTAEDKEKGVSSRRSVHGRFTRTLRLPDHCDCKPESIQAKHENGVLRITVPRVCEPETQKPTTDIKID